MRFAPVVNPCPQRPHLSDAGLRRRERLVLSTARLAIGSQSTARLAIGSQSTTTSDGSANGGDGEVTMSLGCSKGNTTSGGMNDEPIALGNGANGGEAYISIDENDVMDIGEGGASNDDGDGEAPTEDGEAYGSKYDGEGDASKEDGEEDASNDDGEDIPYGEAHVLDDDGEGVYGEENDEEGVCGEWTSISKTSSSSLRTRYDMAAAHPESSARNSLVTGDDIGENGDGNIEGDQSGRDPEAVNIDDSASSGAVGPANDETASNDDGRKSTLPTPNDINGSGVPSAEKSSADEGYDSGKEIGGRMCGVSRLGPLDDAEKDLSWSTTGGYA